MLNFHFDKLAIVSIFNGLCKRSFPLAKICFYLMRLVAKSGAEKINLGRDEHYFVESPEDGIRIYHAYPGRCLGYFHGVKSTLVAYKDRYVLPNFNEEDSLKIIDCGGNIGEFSYSFMLAYPNATMFTFEPSPFEFEILQKNHRENKNKIELVNKALGEQTGTIDFYVKSEHADSTTIEPLHYEQRIKVPLVTLDDFFKDKGSLAIDLLKLEAEGAEPEVLLGGTELLQRTRYVTVDWGPERGMSEDTTLASVCNILYPLGFEMQELKETHYTCLFKNKNFS